MGSASPVRVMGRERRCQRQFGRSGNRLAPGMREWQCQLRESVFCHSLSNRMAQQPKPNRLVHEKSPYLLQHAHNPVDWFPWGTEAFAAARAHNRPIFLSIGYSTCHWCHVMERESFENPVIANLLNNYFVSIKVDREERPDVDRVYMTFVQGTTGSGGWPMSIFLTP